MKKVLCGIAVAMMILACCGCDMYVSGDKYRILQRDFETQISLNQTMKEEMRAMREELIVTKNELEAATKELGVLRQRVPMIPPDEMQEILLQEASAPDTETPSPPSQEDLATASAPQEGTSSVSDVMPEGDTLPASQGRTSSVASVPPATDEKTQLKFKDIADALG